MSFAKKLKTIAENTKSMVSTPTDDRKTMAYWFAYLNSSGRWNDETLYENIDYIEELEYPRGTQNIDYFSDMFTFYYYSDGAGMITKETLPIKKLIGTLDMSGAKSLANVFWGLKYCTDLGNVIFPERGKVKNFSGLFLQCNNLEKLPTIDTYGATDLSHIFSGCKKINPLPWIDTSSAENVSGMCSQNPSITTVPLYDLSKATNFLNFFYECPALTDVPLFDLKNATSLQQMFLGCTSLETIPELDIRNCTNAANVIMRCSKIKDVRFKNIKTALPLSPSSLLTVDSLLFEIQELRDIGTVKTLTIGATNLAKISSIYVKTVPITDDMRAEDDLIDEKLPFEVCESTDTGAMLITDYALSKNWQIK